jgi:hypothetical protein
MTARKPKATNIVSLANRRRPSVGVAPQQPDPRLMEKVRLIVEMADTFGVDLRVAAAIQRGDITVTPGGG